MILVSNIHIWGIPDLVMGPESTLDIAMWVKYKMTAIYVFEKKQIRDF